MAGRPRSWIHVIGFAAAIATAAFVTLDIEYPRLGLIRVDSFDRDDPGPAPALLQAMCRIDAATQLRRVIPITQTSTM